MNKTQNAFNDIIEEHHTMLMAYALRLTNNYQEAEDILQEAYLKLWKKIDALLLIDNKKAFLYRCVHNLFIDKYRSQAIKNKSIQALKHFEETQTTNMNQIEDQQLAAKIAFELQKLQMSERSLIVLFEVEGYSIQEISLILNKPEGTVKSGLKRAREKLRDLCTFLEE